MTPAPPSVSVLEKLRGRHNSGRPPLLATVSGIASTSIAMIDWFARETCVDIVTTKSVQREQNPGNREPVIVQPFAGCFGNAVGLRNPGMEATATNLEALHDLWRINPPSRRPLINVSLSASSAEDFAVIARRLEPYADMFELNFSCPHAAAGFGASIGSDPEAVGEFTARVVAEVETPVFVKLTPNVDDIAAIAARAVDAGADGLVAINTVGPARYLELRSGSPVLSNPPDGEGGMSGDWIHAIAIDAVRSIRVAVGPDVPVIGMGGVTSRERSVAMQRAGADVVGIGSVLGTVHQREWPSLLAGISSEDRDAGPSQPDIIRKPASAHRSTMGYTRFAVTSTVRLDPTMIELTLDGLMAASPGQTVFLWIPGLGEKPFAVALNNPPTFVVKIKGSFTQGLARLKPGDHIYVRGPYGDRHPVRTGHRVVMVVAGTGIAAVSLLAHELISAGCDTTLLVGLRSEYGPSPLYRDAVLSRITTVVRDDGKIGAVLDVFARQLQAATDGGVRVYVVGPVQFTDRATAIALEAGIDPTEVMVALERRMMCGVGLCGACDCGGRLTCQYGTLVTAADLQNESPGSGTNGGIDD